MNDILIKALNDNNFDLVIENGDLKTGDNLKTAVYISLFTWARAKENDEVLEGNSKNGWWGDNLSDNHNIKIGSRLWLLKREKITQETINKAVEYSKEALQWMKDANVVSEIEITAIRKENDIKKYINPLQASKYIGHYDKNRNYMFNELVALEGMIYYSLIDNNIANDPLTDTTNWANYIDLISNQFVNLDGSNATFNNLSVEAKQNIMIQPIPDFTKSYSTIIDIIGYILPQDSLVCGFALISYNNAQNILIADGVSIAVSSKADGGWYSYLNVQINLKKGTVLKMSSLNIQLNIVPLIGGN